MINDELVLEIVLQVLEKYTEQQEQKASVKGILIDLWPLFSCLSSSM